MKINTEINTPGVTPSPTCDNARELLVVDVSTTVSKPVTSTNM